MGLLWLRKGRVIVLEGCQTAAVVKLWHVARGGALLLRLHDGLRGRLLWSVATNVQIGVLPLHASLHSRCGGWLVLRLLLPRSTLCRRRSVERSLLWLRKHRGVLRLGWGGHVLLLCGEQPCASRRRGRGVLLVPVCSGG